MSFARPPEGAPARSAVSASATKAGLMDAQRNTMPRILGSESAKQALLYAPGTALHMIVRRERGEALFRAPEALLFAALSLAAVVALVALVSGAIAI